MTPTSVEKTNSTSQKEILVYKVKPNVQLTDISLNAMHRVEQIT